MDLLLLEVWVLLCDGSLSTLSVTNNGIGIRGSNCTLSLMPSISSEVLRFKAGGLR